MLLFGPLLLQSQQSIPSTWTRKDVPVYVSRSKADVSTKRQIVLYELWTHPVKPCTVHVVDRADAMIRDATDARAFFSFLSPLVHIPSALESMVAKGEVSRVS